MRKIVLLFLLFITSSILISCGGNKYVLAVRIRHAGSVVFWEGDGSNYIFEGGKLSKTTAQCYVECEDYIYDKNGISFNLTSMDKEVLDTTTMISKSSLNPKIYEFNLDNLNGYITIESVMDNVHIYSSNPNITKNVSIYVAERSRPLNVKFTNVNIKPYTFIPAFFNFNDVDINMTFDGVNTIEAGECHLTYADASYFDSFLVDSIEYKYFGAFKDFLEVAYAGAESTDYYSFVTNVSGELIEITENGIDYFENLLFGSTGSKGFDGHAAISSVAGVSILGTGTVKIIGGCGARGSNATGGMLGNNGGDGGNGGSGILAQTIAIINPNCEVLGGKPGEGGNKNTGLTGMDDVYDGSRGISGRKTNCKYYFNAKN